MFACLGPQKPALMNLRRQLAAGTGDASCGLLRLDIYKES
jgi:hypothetical protein